MPSLHRPPSTARPVRAVERTVPIGAVVATFLVASSAVAQLRVVTYNVAQLNGDLLALGEVIAALADDDTPGFALAPSAIVLQEVRSQDVATLFAVIDGAIPQHEYALATFTSSPLENAQGGAQALVYRVDQLVEIPANHADVPTGGGARNSDRWNVQLVGYSSPLAQLWIYGSHLKAGSSSSDEQQRLAGVQLLRADADALPRGSKVIYAGDMNLSAHTEPAYQAFFAPGPQVAVDPLGTGSWSGPSNAIKHTQSPRDITVDGLTGGGMDDRFDFALLTPTLVDGQSISMIADTYRAVGNDGLHWNLAINAGNNVYFPGDIPRSNALANALFDASDHIPVAVELTVPAKMGVGFPPDDFGKVIVGTSFGVEVLVANIAEVVTPFGVDTLHFVAEGSGDLSGNVQDSVGAAPAVATAVLPVDTSTVGFRFGMMTVTALSEAAQFGSAFGVTSGTVVRKSNASFSGAQDIDLLSVSTPVTADSGVQPIVIPIHNIGFDNLQALLDVIATSGATGRFSIPGPLPTQIGSTAKELVVHFDTDGAAIGNQTAVITITCRDEEIPGAANQTILLILTAQVQPSIPSNPADLNGDGIVDGADLGILLLNWGACEGCAADLNGDGVVDGADLGILLLNWR